MILNEIDNAYVGSEQVDKIYLGEDEVWSNTPPVQDTPFTLEVTSPGDIHFSHVYGSQSHSEIDASFNVYKNGVLFDSFNTSTWGKGSGVTYSAVSGDTFEFIASGTNETLAKWTGSYSVNGNISVTALSFLGYSGTTATCNVYGNILSLLTNQYTGRTTFAPDFTYHSMPNGFYSSMFTGLFREVTTIGDVSQLKLPSDVTDACYAMMFYWIPIVKSPVLPAATLSRFSYNEMFARCTSLNHIKCLATDISELHSTYRWVYGVPNSGGTFVKAASMNNWTTGNNGIPSGWTVVDAS